MQVNGAMALDKVVTMLLRNACCFAGGDVGCARTEFVIVQRRNVGEVFGFRGFWRAATLFVCGSTKVVPYGVVAVLLPVHGWGSCEDALTRRESV